MRASLLAVAALAACSADATIVADAPVVADAPIVPIPDSPPGTPDAPAPKNPPVLWLAGINGSESNLELRANGPPSPY